MRITFKDQSFIELAILDEKYIISIQAKDYLNPLKKITNSVELTKEQFEALISTK